jgi:hypothetical protein
MGYHLFPRRKRPGHGFFQACDQALHLDVGASRRANNVVGHEFELDVAERFLSARVVPADRHWELRGREGRTPVIGGRMSADPALLRRQGPPARHDRTRSRRFAQSRPRLFEDPRVDCRLQYALSPRAQPPQQSLRRSSLPRLPNVRSSYAGAGGRQARMGAGIRTQASGSVSRPACPDRQSTTPREGFEYLVFKSSVRRAATSRSAHISGHDFVRAADGSIPPEYFERLL